MIACCFNSNIKPQIYCVECFMIEKKERIVFNSNKWEISRVDLDEGPIGKRNLAIKFIVDIWDAFNDSQNENGTNHKLFKWVCNKALKRTLLSLTKYNLQNLCKNSKSPGIIVRRRISVDKKNTLIFLAQWISLKYSELISK